MRATTVKQIKFNRGQVSDLLSERVDMGLQNACGTVYDNTYINRYGQIQNAPTITLSSSDIIRLNNTTPCYIIGMFDTGEDYVFPLGIDILGQNICVFRPLLKSNPYAPELMSSPLMSVTLTQPIMRPYQLKVYQFGYNMVIYNQKNKPFLINIIPSPTDGWTIPALTVKENYFDNSFDNIYIRGINTETPTAFTPPTSGGYSISDQTAITTQRIVTVGRNSAGGNFTQDLVGQVLLCKANGGALQVRSVESADSLTAYVLSPLTAYNAGQTSIYIPFGDGKSEWLFGYEMAYGDTASPTGTPSYPDSVIYANQRLIFGGNDYHGSLISASRIGVINDFDPETATESDAFTTSIASKDFCRIVDFVVSNNELRIACTNGEYAMSLANLTPSGSLSGFDLRSEVGIAKDSPICDCGGLTAYVSNDRNAVYGTQFNLLRDRYQPISLTSQTSNIINNCTDLKYLKNRPNSEGNCLVGKNSDGSLFVGGIDINAGLINLAKILKKEYNVNFVPTSVKYNLIKIFACGSALWGILDSADRYEQAPQSYIVRFCFGEMFDLPCWVTQSGTYANKLVLYREQRYLYDQSKFYALYYDSTKNSYSLIKSLGLTDNGDNTSTVNFSDDINVANIVCAGFVRQADWRSVEIGVGMATRELNKRIVKLEGVIEPTQVTGQGRFAGLTLTPEQAKNFITLTRSKDVQEMDVDNLSNTSYTESEDLVWRRAFDNPDREMHYGVSFVAPFLVKSITAVIEYDEVA